MAETSKDIKINGKDYIQTTMDNGAVVTVPRPPVTPVVRPDPEYKTLMEKEDLDKIKSGIMTPAEQQKLLVAIALKLKVI